MRFNVFKSSRLLIAILCLCMHLAGSMLWAQDKTVTVRGFVQNKGNEPLTGVSVVMRNSNSNFTAGTNTDSAGIFTFTGVMPGGPYSFNFSSVGYEPQVLSGYNIRNGATLSLSIKMTSSAASLDQVVVVGYGTQLRKDLTGSLASVNADAIRETPVTRIDQALLGKAAGVQVKPVSGEPGVSPKINIRGVGSISAGSNPLYVVDGFPIANIDLLNPNDIESIDILKDASATAIYGSRGSNGVIIINTKRGKAGKMNMAFDTYYGLQKINHKPAMMNAREIAQYTYDGVRNRNLDEGRDVSGPVAGWFRKVPGMVLDVLSGKNTYDQDALDAIFTTAPVQQYQLSASGGTTKLRYALSGEYLTQEGIIKNTDFKRYSVRSNTDAQLTDRLSVKVNLNTAFTTRNLVTASGDAAVKTGGSVVANALAVHNYIPLVNPDGSYFIFSGLLEQGDFFNPLASVNEIRANEKSLQVLGNVNAEYKILKDLRLNVAAGANLSGTRGMRFMPNLPVFLDVPATGSDYTTMVYNWLTETTLNYNKKINKHSIAGLAGFTSQKERFEANSLGSTRYPNNLVASLSAVSNNISNGSSTVGEWALLSYLARINYNYAGKYYLTTSFRTDGSSRFGSEKKWGAFPSAAVAYRISEESFMKNIRLLNELKLRASYGQTGNNNIGNYEHLATVIYGGYPLGGTSANGFAPGKLANPFLTWETQQQFNLGIDAGILQRRITVSVDYFISKNKNLLLNVNIPDLTGFSNTLQNIGEVQNKGWEFVVNTVNLNGNFRWSTDMNLSMFRNKVTKLGPQGDPIYSGGNVTQIGQPIGMFYGWLTDGVFLNQAAVNAGPVFNPGASDRSRPGDMRFVDISGPSGKPDGIISSYDRTVMGSPYPDFYYGMTNQFSYKNLSLSIGLQGSQGIDVLNLSHYVSSSGRGRYRQIAKDNNYWKSEQDPGDGKTPRPNDLPSGNNRGQYSQRYLEDASYLRINTITLAYGLPQRVLQSLKINGFRVYLNASNLFTFTNYSGFNPDVSNGIDPLTPGIDQNNYPLAKSLILGANLSF